MRVRAHDDGPAFEAALYSLGPVGVEDSEHTLTPSTGDALDPAAVFAPVWTLLGQGTRAVWSLLERYSGAPGSECAVRRV